LFFLHVTEVVALEAGGRRWKVERGRRVG